VTPSPAPRSLRVAVGLVAVETLVVWAVVAVLVVGATGDHAGDALRELGYVALYAIALPALGWALLRRRKWVRAPLIVVQLFLIVIAAIVMGAAPVVGGVFIVLALACVVLLLTPGVREAIGARGPDAVR
jgi:hypothetical protein